MEKLIKKQVQYERVYSTISESIPWWHWLFLWAYPIRVYEGKTIVILYKEAFRSMYILGITSQAHSCQYCDAGKS